MKPDVDPATFWQAALETGHPLTYHTSSGADVAAGTVVDPVALLAYSGQSVHSFRLKPSSD